MKYNGHHITYTYFLFLREIKKFLSICQILPNTINNTLIPSAKKNTPNDRGHLAKLYRQWYGIIDILFYRQFFDTLRKNLVHFSSGAVKFETLSTYRV